MIISSIIISALSILLTPILLPLIFPEYNKAVEIIQILSLAIIPVTIVSTFISKFIGSGNNKIVLIGSAINVGISIPTLLLLVTIYGVNGAPISTVISNSVLVIYYLAVDRFYKKNKK